jgi:hypothetical protein
MNAELWLLLPVAYCACAILTLLTKKPRGWNSEACERAARREDHWYR